MADSTSSTEPTNLMATNNTQTSNDRSSSSSTKINYNNNRRPICSRCYRPVPKACICEGLPDQPIELQHCHVLVLQHPHEARRKNRSLPLVELTLSKSSLTTVVSRRFGDQNPNAINLLQKSNRVLLIFPEITDHCSSTDDKNGGGGGDDENDEEQNRSSQVSPVLSLSQAKEYWGRTTTTSHKQDIQSTNNNDAEITNHMEEDKILIVLLDATWKFAKEMDKANIEARQYPKNMKRVALNWDDPARPKEADKAFRFDIRTALSQVHLSTAECLAWVLAALEEKNGYHENDNTSNNNNSGSANSNDLYNALMKPLDVMVEKWNACRMLFGNVRGDRKRKAGNEDDGGHLERNSSKDYSYYGNRDVQAEQSSVTNRSLFFTMGDQDYNKKIKKHKSRGNKNR